jgi:glycosyltransferase involved in cell wall biosynthesis
MNLVLSSYPLTRESLQQLGGASSLTTLTLSELRVRPLPDIFRAMRAARGPVFTVVVQEPSERAVLPLMLTLAGLSSAGRIEVSDMEARTVTKVCRLKALFGMLGTLSATLSGVVSIARLSLQARVLLRARPQNFAPLTSFKALYLKSNLMLGVKAGGSIGHIAGVANELLRIDPGMTVLAPEPPPMVKPEARSLSIDTLKSYGIPPEANHFRFNRNCVESGAGVLSRERFDFIYQRLSLGNLSGVLLSRRFKLPLVLEYNGSEVWISSNWGHSLKYKKLASLIEDCCLRHAYRVVTVSDVLADELKTRGVPAEKTVWYPNCIDPQVFDPSRYTAAREEVRQRVGAKTDEVVVLFLGTFGIWHGAETLAETAKQYFSLPKRDGEPRLKFLFVGDGLRLGSVREKLANEIAEGKVVLTGLVPQATAPEYLAAADIFVSPHVPSTDGSKFFGSPTKLFEYMAMERPIVASKLDQLAEVLHPAADEKDLSNRAVLTGEETAILTEPANSHAILRAILFLRDRPDYRMLLAKNARRRVLNKYTWQHHVDKIIGSIRNA